MRYVERKQGFRTNIKAVSIMKGEEEKPVLLENLSREEWSRPRTISSVSELYSTGEGQSRKLLALAQEPLFYSLPSLVFPTLGKF